MISPQLLTPNLLSTHFCGTVWACPLSLAPHKVRRNTVTGVYIGVQRVSEAGHASEVTRADDIIIGRRHLVTDVLQTATVS